jgi:hypothetical protein
VWVALETHDISMGMRLTSRRAWFGLTMLSLSAFVASVYAAAGWSISTFARLFGH